MNICILNGSPKGSFSVTMRYMGFLQKQFPGQTYTDYPVAERIHKLERDPEAFEEIMNLVREADIILWVFPLYFMLVHSQYKRFIELVFERGKQDAFIGKYAAALATSIHFYDYTAINYIRAVSDDLGMSYLDGFSAHMRDLFHEDKRVQLSTFFAGIIEQAASGVMVPKTTTALRKHRFAYVPGESTRKIDLAEKTLRIITDAQEEDANLRAMTERFAGNFTRRPEIINLRNLDIKGGCLGCIKCGLENICAYEGKDDFIEFYKTKVMTADMLIFAGAVHDRCLSSVWKTFFDRSFFMTHQPKLKNIYLGWLISGPFQQLPDLRHVLTAYTECEGAQLTDFITDEETGSTAIDTYLDGLALRMSAAAGSAYKRPATFLSIAGQKMFRDEIFSNLRFVFRMDHRYYRKNRMYDFPQKRRLIIMGNNLLLFLRVIFPGFTKMFQSKIKEGMVAPYKRFM